MKKILSILLWTGLATTGATALASVALNHGESVNAVWLVTAALTVYFLAYRYYSRFIAGRVLGLDPHSSNVRR